MRWIVLILKLRQLEMSSNYKEIMATRNKEKYKYINKEW